MNCHAPGGPRRRAKPAHLRDGCPDERPLSLERPESDDRPPPDDGGDDRPPLDDGDDRPESGERLGATGRLISADRPESDGLITSDDRRASGDRPESDGRGDDGLADDGRS